MGNKGNKAKKDKEKETIMNFTDSTHFNEVEVGNLYKVFNEMSKNGKVDKPTFNKCLERLEQYGFKSPKDIAFPERLFHMLDINGDGVVDLSEFVCGLSVLCKGTPEEKLKLSFKAYDLDGSGYISKSELSEMFKSAWLSGLKALACEAHQEVDKDQLEKFSSEMAEQFAENAFKTLDENNDGRLSFEEFALFVKAEPKITATLNDKKKDIHIVL